MPEISRFLSIIIRMFYGDHAPPHFHAEYDGKKAVFSINTGEIIAGKKFPKKQAALVKAWAILRKKELLKNWDQMKLEKEIVKIKPLE